MASADIDFDGYRDDFLVYLAKRLGVSHDAAETYLGSWLISFAPIRVGAAANPMYPIPAEEPDGSAAGEAETDDE